MLSPKVRSMKVFWTPSSLDLDHNVEPPIDASLLGSSFVVWFDVADEKGSQRSSKSTHRDGQFDLTCMRFLPLSSGARLGIIIRHQPKPTISYSLAHLDYCELN